MESYLYVGLLTLSLSLSAQEATEPGNSRGHTQGDAFAGDIGPHHRVHAWTTAERDVSGQVRQVPHRVVEIATGMHYWDGEAWVPSEARFEVTPEAFAAERVGHNIRIAELMRSGKFDPALMRDPVIYETTSKSLLSGHHRSIAAEMAGSELPQTPVAAPGTQAGEWSEIPLIPGRRN